ncbi:outer membrane protein assembly factor, partial [Desulfurivibrio sp. D14AmB]|uniref:BamA/OMP85 family outer membrane protein n=1 Tax=Desulfurivibrio sp. D14AmB TaxID=3374370 RepID=UPI00376F3517
MGPLLALLLLILLILLIQAAAAPAWATAKANNAGSFRFQGNHSLTESRLLAAAARELADFPRLGRREAEINDAAYMMQLAYRRAGYYFAEVDYRLQEEEGLEGVSRVTFLINEGPLVLANPIVLLGNTIFSDQELITVVETSLRDGPGSGPPPLVESRLDRALGMIREMYLLAGYWDAEVISLPLRFGPQRLTAEQLREKLFPLGKEAGPVPPAARLEGEITLEIREGLRQLISAVQLAEPEREYPPEIRQAVAQMSAELVGQPYFTRRKLLLRSGLLETYQELGYPEVRVVIHDRPGENPGDIMLLAEVASGAKVRIREIEISGNQRSSDDFILHRLEISPGDIYRDSARRESFRELYRSGLFTRVDIGISPAAEEVEVIAAAEEQRTLLVAVEEAKAQEFFLEAGWGSYEMLRGRVGFIDRNLFGSGRILRLESGASLKGAEIKAGITDPWVLESKITADLPVYYRVREEPAFTRRETGAGLTFSRALPHRMFASLGYQIRRSDISDIEADTTLESHEEDYAIASIKFQLARDTRNDIFFPSAGQRVFGAVEGAEKALGSNLTFYRFTTGWRHFSPLSNRLVLGLRADTGLILPGSGQDNIPVGERFYNGGENSVRSFRQGMLGPKDLAGNPVGGMAYNLLSVELRRRLRDNLAISLFFDYGNLSPNQSRLEEGETTMASRSEVIDATFSDYF